MSKKYLLGGLLVLAVVVVAVALLLRTDIATLNVSSEEGSTIYVASQPSGEFTEIGVTNATFITETGGDYYIKVVKDTKATHTAVKLNPGETVAIVVGLKDLKRATSVSTKALSYPLFTKDFVYGISPASKSLSYAPLGNKEFARFFFFGLPFTTKVEWVDKDNFAFISSSGSGAVVDGSISSLGDPKIKGPSAINNDYLDITVFDGSSVALATVDGVYIKKSLKTANSQKIDSLTIDSGPGLFSDENYIYLVSPNVEFPGDDEGVQPEITSVEFRAYTHAGEKKFDYSLSIDALPTQIVDSDSDYFVFSAGSHTVLLSKTSGQTTVLPVYFPSSNDLVVSKGSLVVLNEDGLWEYNINDNSYYLLSQFPVGQEYVAGSLTNNKGVIYFSVAASKANLQRPSGSLVSDAIYRLEP